MSISVPGNDAETVGPQPAGYLDREMRRELASWRRFTKTFGLTYHGFRIFLIIASAIVAAEKTLADGRFAGLAEWTPVLAVLVAAITAFDTWLKPQKKWRGFMESRDELTSLFIRAENGTGRSEIQNSFDELRRKHREENVV